jgi:hypothetical protein
MKTMYDTLTTAMNREETLEKILALTETIQEMDPTLAEQRARLESDRDKLIQGLNRPRGNPHGNLEAIRPYMFAVKDPEAPLTNRISLRVTERQFANWQQDKEGFTLKFRELLDCYSA